MPLPPVFYTPARLAVFASCSRCASAPLPLPPCQEAAITTLHRGCYAGTGNLTRHLLSAGALVTAVEKDYALSAQLEENFAAVSRIRQSTVP
jgi:hypothetical protein